MIPPTAAIDSPPPSNGREAVKRGVLWELPFSQIFSLLCRRERKEKRPPSGQGAFKNRGEDGFVRAFFAFFKFIYLDDASPG